MPLTVCSKMTGSTKISIARASSPRGRKRKRAERMKSLKVKANLL